MVFITVINGCLGVINRGTVIAFLLVSITNRGVRRAVCSVAAINNTSNSISGAIE